MTYDASFKQVVGSGVDSAMEVVVKVMATVLDRILVQFEVPTSSFGFLLFSGKTYPLR